MKANLASTVLSTALVLAAAAPAAHAGAVNMNPGKWEISVSMEMAGMPAGAMQPHARTECIQAKDTNADWMTKQGQQKDKDCKTTIVKQEAGHLAWTFECASGSTGDADFTFGGDSYDGTMHIKAHEHAITQKIKAHRVGDC